MEIEKIGERKLIEMIRGAYGYTWPNSDSAYVDAGKNRILITNDAITQSTHMPSGADPVDIGYFFAAINLSDIAAMGGTPRYFMSSLILPPKLDSKYLIGLERGMRKCLDRYNVKMIGGDLKKGRELALCKCVWLKVLEVIPYIPFGSTFTEFMTSFRSCICSLPPFVCFNLSIR